MHSTCPEERFEGELFRESLRLFFFKIEQKNSISGGKNSAELSYWHSTCPEERFEEEFFSRESLFVFF